MKKLTIVAASALIATSAFALDTKMELKGRFDYLNDTKQTNGGSKTYAGNYTPGYLRWNTTAKFNETTTAALSLNFAANHAAATTRTLSDMVDTAAVTKSFGSGFSAIIGKQSVLVGGRENDFSGRDMYVTSLFNGNISGAQIGLTAQYDVMGQSFYLQNLESASTTARTDKKITGLAYYGNFMGGMITPILSYHKVGTDVAKKGNIFTTIGTRVTYGQFIVEADYLMYKSQQASGTDPKLNSIVAHVKYNHEMFKPFAKYIMETGKDGYAMDSTHLGAGVTKSERTAWELGLEMYPNKDEDMRYHLVYNSSEMKEKTGGTDKFKEDKIIAGVAFGYNILK